jgi:ribosomal protein S18 acetylase RimI-like enzyme
MLLRAAEAEAIARGAQTMTLHVFSSNKRARGFYERSGYDGELMRYIKPLGE